MAVQLYHPWDLRKRNIHVYTFPVNLLHGVSIHSPKKKTLNITRIAQAVTYSLVRIAYVVLRCNVASYFYWRSIPLA